MNLAVTAKAAAIPCSTRHLQSQGYFPREAFVSRTAKRQRAALWPRLVVTTERLREFTNEPVPRARERRNGLGAGLPCRNRPLVSGAAETRLYL